MIETNGTISTPSARFSAVAAGLQFKRLGLQGRLFLEPIEFMDWKVKFGEDGKLTVVCASPAEVSFEIGGNRVVISPMVFGPELRA